jgi:hypothetical protein
MRSEVYIIFNALCKKNKAKLYESEYYFRVPPRAMEGLMYLRGPEAQPFAGPISIATAWAGRLRFFQWAFKFTYVPVCLSTFSPAGDI